MRLVNERLFSSVVLAVCYPSISFLLFPPPFIQPRRFVLRSYLLPFLPKPLVNFFVQLYVLRFFYSSYAFLFHLLLLPVSLFLPEARTLNIISPWYKFLFLGEVSSFPNLPLRFHWRRIFYADPYRSFLLIPVSCGSFQRPPRWPTLRVFYHCQVLGEATVV